jgi:nicotinamide-nucleotide amidase
MTAEIVTIGDELLDGTVANGNAERLGAVLRSLGVRVVRATTVPDEPAAIEGALRAALESADVVVTTGGLGATADDRTKQVAARVLGRKLVLDEDVLARVRAHFESRGLVMPEVNVAQAMVPEGARPIENASGTAPGLALDADGALLFLFPGVPSEMEAMVSNYLVPFLEGRGARRRIEERTLRTTGVPETAIAEIVVPLSRKLARIDVQYLPSLLGVDLRITGRGESAADASKAADRASDMLADALAPFVYARGRESLEEIVGYLLTMNGKTLAVAESCTAGALGARITEVPGSSDYFRGGVVAYSDDLKRRLLGVRAGTLRKHGAVSAEVALEMAKGARDRGRTDCGIGITGIAGPGGGSPEKPVGLVYVAVACGRKAAVREHRFPGARSAVREQAVQAALELTRRALLGIEGEE